MRTLRPTDSPDHEVSLTEPLLDAADVAGLLGVPRSTVHAYARAARDPLPCVRVGRHPRFQRLAVERWLERRVPAGLTESGVIRRILVPIRYPLRLQRPLYLA